MHMLQMDTPYQVPARGELIIDYLLKQHAWICVWKAREETDDKAEDHKSHAACSCSQLVLYLSRQHVPTMSDLMSRKGLSHYTPVCFSPPAYAFIHDPSISIQRFSFSFPCNTWESCRGNKPLPAFRHIPAANAWAKPHMVGIPSFKGAVFHCLAKPHHSNKGMWALVVIGVSTAFQMVLLFTSRDYKRVLV